MLSRIISMFHMSKAAVVVQNLLEQHSANGLFRIDAQGLSNKWVASVYSQKPDMLGGRFGKRPHKISVAAVALAQGLTDSGDEDVRTIAMASLCTIISEVCANGQLYPFNGIDHILLEIADKVYLERMPSLSTASVFDESTLGTS